MTTAIDLFAGAGGWSTGATQAGVRVLVAANHWPRAVETHAANHPETTHLCQDLGLANPHAFPDHDLLLASPACQGHSRARGTDKPHHDAMRSTAWCVVNVAEAKRPKLLAVENVPEFRTWALFDLWCQALERLGYALTSQVLDAADFGVPQERRRLFVLGELGTKAPRVISTSLAPKVPIRNVLRLEEGKWSAVDRPGRAASTLARVAAGRERFGDDFLVAYYGATQGGRSLDRPVGTLTTRDRYALVRGNRMRMLSVSEQQAAMGFPSDYRLTGTYREQVHQLGNAVCPPVARAVVNHLLSRPQNTERAFPVPAERLNPANPPKTNKTDLTHGVDSFRTGGE